MSIDRKLATDLAAQIISLLPDEHFKTHHASALAAMVLFARNMSEEQQKVNSDINEIFETNIPAMRAYVRDFHILAADSSRAMLAQFDKTLQELAEKEIVDARIEAVREIKKSLRAQIVNFNKEIPIVTANAVRAAIKAESRELGAMTKLIADAMDTSRIELLEIIANANGAIRKIDISVSIIEQKCTQLVIKGYFQRIFELFFGSKATNRYDEK